MPGTLVELEQAVSVAEQAPSQESTCDRLRPGKELQGALRWLRRRLNAVDSCLIILKGLMPKLFTGCERTLAAFSAHLRVSPVLPELREIAAAHLHYLPAPSDFSPAVPVAVAQILQINTKRVLIRLQPFPLEIIIICCFLIVLPEKVYEK